jgi:hypothetical protein
MLAALAQRFQTVTDPVDQVVEGFTAWMGLSSHPLFREIDQIRRAELIQTLGHGEPSPMSIAHKAISANIATAQALGKIPLGDPGRQADALLHIAIGYLAVPSLTDDVTSAAATAHLARIAIAPILTGSSAT